jgi:hypothetical protein
LVLRKGQQVHGLDCGARQVIRVSGGGSDASASVRIDSRATFVFNPGGMSTTHLSVSPMGLTGWWCGARVVRAPGDGAGGAGGDGAEGGGADGAAGSMRDMRSRAAASSLSAVAAKRVDLRTDGAGNGDGDGGGGGEPEDDDDDDDDDDDEEEEEEEEEEAAAEDDDDDDDDDDDEEEEEAEEEAAAGDDTGAWSRIVLEELVEA